ncbi:putative alcohol dehydrogenase [Colletotrichum phormii]|uniref:Alcohol dehydrogenase n=1 Tax=Colletotrichum phormii TaxID=359342 RepID=A0AAI9ZU53_9PEZI|nr:putative alcohol dehydrogenase [Colletotrichum phormii]KAK1637890.1 putative alcohol dehydrogenase [Colletotrichum phormii]
MTGAALFVESDGKVTTRRELPPVTARDNEILIDVLYSGVNPADLKIVHFINYRNSVPGTDFCGKVLDCPALVDSGFKVGGIVAGQTVPHGEQSKEYGSHKPRISTPQIGLFKVPENMAHSDAAAITTVSHTASDALYNNFKLPLPGSSPDGAEGTLVVWGGGTAVGLSAIQLARASGVTNIITTASPSRHDLLRGLGATECFDYKDANVSDKVKQSVIKASRSRIWGFETAGSPESSQLLLDALSGIVGDVHYSWVNAAGAQRPPTEAVLGTRDYEIVFEVPGGRHVIPAEPEKAANLWAALDWAVKNYGKGFELPVVRVFEGTGEEALEEMETVSKQGAFGKLVLKHPLQ